MTAPTLPSGIVTFLFTDIQGSTPLWESMPGEMKSSLSQHHTILRNAIEANGGHVYQVIGDAFQAAFRLASPALAAALEAQRQLESAQWGATGALHVRMGLHTGPAEIDEQGNAPYEVCHTLNRAARVMSAAHGRQILLTQETAHLASYELPEAVVLKDLGEFHLKGMQRSEHLFQVIAPDLPSTFPPPASLPSHSNNLPVQTTVFIGREKEIGQVSALLNRHRLVTLTGSGGTGKTRLSLQVAMDTLHLYPNGAWLAELAPLSEPEKITQTVAETLGLRESSDLPILDVLSDYLKTRRLLLVLDNCEHLIDACARLVDRLLQISPGLTVLASSREALGIMGEVSYRVPSLPAPDPRQSLSLEVIAQSEAVCLFENRASLVLPGFLITLQNAQAVARICYRLDGIPLAIELAAARVTTLSAEQIADRLVDRFRLLTGGSRTALPRQQTLRASIDWSYSLLSNGERQLLRRLAVFVGGWSLEAAESICIDDKIEAGNILEVLTALVKKSLVVFVNELENPRYYLLETIRQFAREKLLDDENSQDLRRRHLQYFLQFVEQAERELHGSQQRQWMDRIENELDNLRAALEWGLSDGSIENLLTGLSLISQIGMFDISFDANEGFQWFEKYLTLSERLGEIPTGLRKKVELAKGTFLFRLSNFEESHQAFKTCLSLFKESDDAQKHVEILVMLVYSAFWSQNFLEQMDWLNQAFAFAQQAGLYQQNLAPLFECKGWMYHETDKEIAKQYFMECLELYEKSGNQIGTIAPLRYLGEIASTERDFTRSETYLKRAVTTSRAMKSWGNLMWDLCVSGDCAYWAGHFPEMEAFFQEAREVSEKIGFRRGFVWSIHHTGVAACRMDQTQRAIRLLRESLALAIEYGYTELAAESIGSLAGIAADLGRDLIGARLVGAMDNVTGKLPLHNMVLNDIQRASVMIKERLGDAAFEEAFNVGKQLTIEDAAELSRAVVA